MISIEKTTGGEAQRFDFNKPFKCITIEYGHSNDVLPGLRWDQRTIAWLDYTERLNASILADVAVFCRSAAAGSVLVVTLNAGPGSQSEKGGSRLERLTTAVGRPKAPPGLSERDLEAEGTAAVYWRIFCNEVVEALQARNAALDAPHRIAYRQLLNFRYKDTSKMATFGGILFHEKDRAQINSCRFEALPFVRTAGEPFVIRVPSLTFKEVRYLDAQLPIIDPGEATSPGLGREDIEAYTAMYPWFPAFTEVEL